MQIHVALRQRGWSGRTREKTPVVVSYKYTFFTLFFGSRRARKRGPILTIYRPTLYDVLPPKAVPFGRLDRSYEKLKFPTFKNPRWRTTAILKNGKSAIEQYLIMRRPVRIKSAIHRVGISRIISYVIYFTYFT